jgi:hypothetical protein
MIILSLCTQDARAKNPIRAHGILRLFLPLTVRQEQDDIPSECIQSISIEFEDIAQGINAGQNRDFFRIIHDRINIMEDK